MKTIRSVIAGCVLAACVVSTASATTDEDIYGRYAFSDASFSIRFDWKPGSLHGLVVKGHRYGTDVVLRDNATDGFLYNYDAEIPQAAGSHHRTLLRLTAYIDQQRGPLLVTGTYVELDNDKQDGERLISSKVFTLRRIRRFDLTTMQ